MKCDHCDKPAVVHEMTVKNGAKREVHLCAQHAKQAGIDVSIHQPINQLLTQFVQHVSTAGAAVPVAAPTPRKACAGCGLTWAQFRQVSLLGCAECYDSFEPQLAPLIERAQNGGVNHLGKTRKRGDGTLDRQALIRQIVREIDEAVAAEQYERAAKLRDRLSGLEKSAADGARQTQPGHGAAPAGPQTNEPDGG